VKQDFPQTPFGSGEFWDWLRGRGLVASSSRFSQGFSILIIFLAACVCARESSVVFRRKKLDSIGIGRACFWMIGSLTLSMTFALLAYLSIKNPPVYFGDSGQPWATVSELRYYAPTWFFFLIGIVLISQGSSFVNRAIALTFVSLALFATLAHSKSMAVWISSNAGPPPPSPEVMALGQAVAQFSSLERVAIISSAPGAAEYILGRPVLDSGHNLKSMSASEPVNLVIAVWRLKGNGAAREDLSTLALKIPARLFFTSDELNVWISPNFSGMTRGRE